MQGGGPPARSVAVRVRARRLVLVLGIVGAVIAADQATKTWAEHRLARGPVHVLGPLNLRLVYNTGFSFSLGAGHALVVSILAAMIAGGLLVYAVMAGSAGRSAAAALVVGGAFSNLADRVFRHHHGAVIDFISLPHWPVFNLADAFITVGVVALIVQGARASR